MNKSNKVILQFQILFIVITIRIYLNKRRSYGT